MRYVNLKKRNSSKTSYLAKRIIATSYIAIRLASLLLIPLFENDSNVKAEVNYDIVDISNESINDNASTSNTLFDM